MPKPPAKPPDRLEKGPRRGTAPSMVSPGLPTAEPEGARDNERAALVRTIEELEQTFRFMGSAHPDYARTRDRLEQLRGMLAKLT
jgi:hypothetical protein